MSSLEQLRAEIRVAGLRDEESACADLIQRARLSGAQRERIATVATRWVEHMRRQHRRAGTLDAFLHEYALSSPEGVALMCLAEALVRIPDDATADRLIQDRLGTPDWEKHLGHSDSLLVNASTWALMFTGRLLAPEQQLGLAGTLTSFAARSGEPLIRAALKQAMYLLGDAFILGRTIGEALSRAEPAEERGYRHSFDMLGESARTAADARRYFEAYLSAVQAIGAVSRGRDLFAAPSLSVKLSALHPRYEFSQRERVLRELPPRLLDLATSARASGIGLTLDAEESDRLELSLDVFQRLAAALELSGWNGLGLAVQAYQKRALAVIGWLAQLARETGRRIPLRLVKGAYWDSEIKLAQERGLAGYPVFTRKQATDASYIACAKRLLAEPMAFYPAFATHNALTAATVLELAGGSRDFEFQRLHGMGEDLYEQIAPPGTLGLPCRVYAPVGGHADLLAYLVRRLLENGANSSFVNRLSDAHVPLTQLLADPVESLAAAEPKRHPRIPLPRDLYSPDRRNSAGLDLNDGPTLAAVSKAARGGVVVNACPLVDGSENAGQGAIELRVPADRGRVLGSVADAGVTDIEQAMSRAAAAFAGWSATPPAQRAQVLERAADGLEARTPEFAGLIAREGGRTLADAVSEVREAVDFLRYYAARGRELFGAPLTLPGPAGEINTLAWHGRGVFVCISPWNFPLAIFVGQVAAALAAGNTVAAKPAEQTPLVAFEAVRLLHAAGVPGAALNLLPGDGTVGAQLVADPRCAGVAFTGSVEAARHIARSLAAKEGPIVPLIAETGGMNAMIVDSSALIEQVVRDVLRSAFNSAGQRCSALRVLFVQEEIAEALIAMLAGAMRELAIGDPADPATDIGPVIEAEACRALGAHTDYLDRVGRLIHRCALPPACAAGSYFAPCAYEIDRLDRLDGEVFGPVLHLIRWRGEDLDAVIDAVNATGYGLTLGIHSRVGSTVQRILSRARVGNAYVNRSMIGAVVGTQPFGGEGLSGTGPKAGGPHYLHRFALERCISTDTTAAGGNASLLCLDDGAAA
ncbi:bifunctional proline dehydrogenase/L-glutamate gamma-semialdehyde dehydrogenase PutA [Methyloterricola oryzae]|uniref:bifunctional proline dehydrogenase/L-glutamate gamma-semialdehyde dehydrogenase PutA n=1 Tax=Methyloterricola oryzae TaxID=1495050 RepID=UPI0005EACBDC|nr:bifunctional proline dehydrogenase/L-glutamate gamma-semialdehyde dehydrogenase PutA [Methyloterricola oryzae]